jgi:hypothetical protein
MTFKIKDGVAVGTANVFNSSGQLTTPQIKDAGSAFAVSLTPATLTANRTYTLPDKAGTIAMTSDITSASKATATVLGTVKLADNAVQSTAANAVTTTASRSYGVQLNGSDQMVVNVPWTDTLPNSGALTLSIGTAAATATTVTIGTGTGFNANSSSASTYDIRVGPALTALATLMTTAGAGFIKRGASADTYTIDTNTYLTSYTETDTLQTVTGRGATSNVATVSLSGGTASTTTGTGTLVVTGGVGVSGAINVGGNAAVGGNLTVTGNLTVDGTTTTVNSTTLTVDDKNIELGSIASPTDTTADGGGITLKGATDKTFNWVDATDSWTSSEHLAVAAGKTLRVSGSTSGTAIITAPAAAGSPTLTLPTTTGTVALTSDIKDGTLGSAAGTAGATNTTVALNFSTTYSANTTNNVTINPVVGPALTALASTMTGATSGFLKKTGADTYTVDTNTYLTGYTETDTLATVTGRGATTSTAVTFTSTTDSTSLTTGAVQVSGGLAVTKNLVVGGEHINTTNAGTVISSANAVQASVSTVNATPVDSWAVGTYRSAKYLVQITQGSNYQVSELLVIHNGTTTFMTEFAVLETNGALGTFTSDVSGGNARLIVTMGSATAATINIEKIAVVI